MAAVSGGPGCVRVWCQKQLIGFSLQSVESAVSSDKDGEERVETNQELPSCFYQSGSESVAVTETFHVLLLFYCLLRITFSCVVFLKKIILLKSFA